MDGVKMYATTLSGGILVAGLLTLAGFSATRCAGNAPRGEVPCQIQGAIARPALLLQGAKGAGVASGKCDVVALAADSDEARQVAAKHTLGVAYGWRFRPYGMGDLCIDLCEARVQYRIAHVHLVLNSDETSVVVVFAWRGAGNNSECGVDAFVYQRTDKQLLLLTVEHLPAVALDDVPRISTLEWRREAFPFASLEPRRVSPLLALAWESNEPFASQAAKIQLFQGRATSMTKTIEALEKPLWKWNASVWSVQACWVNGP